MIHLLHIPSGKYVNFLAHTQGNIKFQSLGEWSLKIGYSDSLIIETLISGSYCNSFYKLNEIPKIGLLRTEFEVVDV